ncbi:MAG TPA: hypothetical protein VHQ98_01785 [Gaiellaceae bacterium]|nr:hypothetical protein [Gaiellaceae bacterium]
MSAFPLDVTRRQEAPLARQHLIRALAVHEPELVGTLGVPGKRARRGVDLERQRILAALALLEVEVVRRRQVDEVHGGVRERCLEVP